MAKRRSHPGEGRGLDQRIVFIRQYLTREEDIKTYVAVQQEFLTHEPAGMLLVPTPMVWPEIHVEIEAVALVASGR
jgi:2-iminobutanoate/2-iminopropanoate deaminase